MSGPADDILQNIILPFLIVNKKIGVISNPSLIRGTLGRGGISLSFFWGKTLSIESRDHDADKRHL
jgi:hypothetical protein